MGEEQKVRVLQGLINVPVGHQLLVGKSFVGFLFLEPGVNMGWGEFGSSGNYFWNDTFEIFDNFFKV